MWQNLLYSLPALMAVTEYLTKKFHRNHLVTALLMLAVMGTIGVIKPSHHVVANNYKYVTVHFDGTEKTLATDAKTVGELLERAAIPLDTKDVVEPAKETALISDDYNVNVYRARPVTVLDAGNRYAIITAAQSPKQIAEAAGLTIHPEDALSTSRIDDFVGEGTVGMKVAVDRATPINFSMYGNPTTARTQAVTVAEFLKEKGVSLKDGDTISPAPETAISTEMIISVNHNGTQLITTEEDVPFEIETIRDADREVGYKEVKEAGQKGRKLVTYEVKMENGREVSRKPLNSIVKTAPKKQVEVAGTKAKIAGDFASALAKLRSCEGSYTSVNAAGGYYGAYQFNQSTWNGAAPAGYAGVRPDQTPPEVQDAAAANLYKRRGWQPWPACSRSQGLQDVYR